MSDIVNNSKSSLVWGRVGKIVSYVVFVSWTLITIVPLIWMSYSSLKSNEELTRDIYAFPYELFDNMDDEYTVIRPDLNTIRDYDPKVDKRERICIESNTIAPGRRLMVFFLVKEDMPPEIQNLKIGDTVTVRDLPGSIRRYINRKTMRFNYESAFIRGGLAGKFANSIIYASVSTFLIILLGSMTAFAISKMQFAKLSKILMIVYGLGYLISIPSLIIPLFLMMTKVGLIDTHLGLILVYVAFGMPLAVLLSSQFMQGLPSSLVESAYIDGASVFRTFWSIILPMTTPVIITISILSALGIWNEFLLVLVLASSEFTKSLPVGVYSFSSLTGTQLGWQLAALVIATLPAMIVYFTFNQRLTNGVVAGAVKE
ncbi:carbohydrate ABC transporter permease [Spirochaeta isovalerica]|uniref:Raffinose/stachyose/melibiose transport system permease protein n=1 Tax=Spirochaeta isovalerica TaxID=150 RepID=A0A841RCM9_9SPIO|nr:carbohydrate ABC transporter permease [Spirochaeta isovalerica]MBB6481693.1 raffinose/stachyose/melibiose transport system permease protein [Spirochaeta isovalerica]